MLKYWDISALAKSSKSDHILDVFSDWADSICIESYALRHKFRLPTSGIFETKIFQLFWRYTPFDGTWTNIFQWKNTFPIFLISHVTWKWGMRHPNHPCCNVFQEFFWTGHMGMGCHDIISICHWILNITLVHLILAWLVVS
jgi:hypothetical protein